MNCRMIHDRLPDMVLENAPATPEIEVHLHDCAECSSTLEALRATMGLLDEWKAPEPSPYWDVRMQARLREEQQKSVSRGWLQWFRRPVFSVAAALCLIAGVGFYQVNRFLEAGDMPVPVAHFVAPTGTAVADLQYLDLHSDMLQNFDALDTLDGDDDADTSN